MDINIVIGGATIQVSGVDEPGAVTGGSFPTQAAQIEDALRRLPMMHLSMSRLSSLATGRFAAADITGLRLTSGSTV